MEKCVSRPLQRPVQGIVLSSLHDALIPFASPCSRAAGASCLEDAVVDAFAHTLSGWRASAESRALFGQDAGIAPSRGQRRFGIKLGSKSGRRNRDITSTTAHPHSICCKHTETRS